MTEDLRFNNPTYVAYEGNKFRGLLLTLGLLCFSMTTLTSKADTCISVLQNDLMSQTISIDHLKQTIRKKTDALLSLEYPEKDEEKYVYDHNLDMMKFDRPIRAKVTEEFLKLCIESQIRCREQNLRKLIDRLPSTNLISMNEYKFIGEDQRGVVYLKNANERSPYLVKSAEDISKFQQGAQPSQNFIFVIDEHGNLLIHNEPKLGSIHHSTLSAGRPVIAAGELIIRNGRIVNFSNRSGHYLTNQNRLHAVWRTMIKLGLLTGEEAITKESDPESLAIEIWNISGHF